VSVIVQSQNAVPVVVERAMWWPGPTAVTWDEAHVSAGVTTAAARWLAAGGESGGARHASTYVLVANTGAQGAAVDIAILFEDRSPVTRSLMLEGTSRFSVDVVSLFPETAGRTYGVLVEAADPATPLVVERATYWNAAGAFWAAGVNAVARPLP
jgi:hypothetical protein